MGLLLKCTGCAWLLSLILSPAAGQCVDEDYKYYAMKTEYDASRYKDPVESDPSCEPLAIWALHRHAYRYDRVTDQEAKLIKIRDEIISKAGQGSLCQETRDALSSWVMQMTPADDMKQPESGWEELRGVGKRLKDRYPALFTSYNESKHALRHSNTSADGDRTGDSARAWAEGLFGTFQGVKLVESGSPDWLLRYYRICDKYIKEVRGVEAVERNKFRKGPEMDEALRNTTELLGLPADFLDYDQLFQMYEMCRLERGIYKSSAWCGVLTTDVLKVMEFEDDIYWYYNNSYAFPINSKMPCSLMVDAMGQLSAVKNGKSGHTVIGNFAHLPTVNSFYTLLGLFKDDEDLKADGFVRQVDRKYRISLNSPMSANIVFVLSSCPSGHVVEAFVNERPVTIPGCDSLKCPYDTIEAIWKPIADGCDIEKICKVDDETSSSAAQFISSVIMIILLIFFNLQN